MALFALVAQNTAQDVGLKGWLLHRSQKKTICPPGKPYFPVRLYGISPPHR
jgi:hypothetical protein